jgi:hypothetical protein
MTEEKKNESGSNEPMTRQKFESEIVLKAWKDPEYKKRLLTSPKEVIQEELRKIRSELTLPENLQVYVHEETPNAVHMTLPANPAEHGEVSGEEWLDSVSGGTLIAVIVNVVVSPVPVPVNVVVNLQVAANVNTTT